MYDKAMYRLFENSYKPKCKVSPKSNMKAVSLSWNRYKKKGFTEK
jgi:hypothetical protein